MFIDGVWLNVSGCEELSVRSRRLSLAAERRGQTPKYHSDAQEKLAHFLIASEQE